MNPRTHYFLCLSLFGENESEKFIHEIESKENVMRVDCTMVVELRIRNDFCTLRFGFISE